MFTLSTLRKSSSVIGQHGDDVENAQLNDALIEEKARGKLPMDPATDLARMTDQTLEASRTNKDLMERFDPQRTDNQVRSRLANVDGVAVPNQPIFKTALSKMFLIREREAIAKAAKKAKKEERRRARGRFAPKTTFTTASGDEHNIDDIAGVSVGKEGLNVHGKDGSTKTVEPDDAKGFLEWHGKHVAAQEHASQYDDGPSGVSGAIGDLGTPQSEWLTRVAAEIDQFAGLKSVTLPAIGDDSGDDGDTDSALYEAIAKVPDADTLDYAGALKGLAAQKNVVLNIMLDPTGDDTLYHISVPHDTSEAQWPQNLKQLQAVLDKAELPSRVFVKTEHGTDVVIFEQGGEDLMESVQRATQFLPGAMSEHAKCTGKFIGAEDDDEAAQAFRTIIYSYEKARGVHYESQQEYPQEEQSQYNQQAAQKQASSKGIGASMPVMGKAGAGTPSMMGAR